MHVDKSFPYGSKWSYVVSMELHDPFLQGKLKETADFKIKKDTGYPYSLKYNILNNFASFIMYVKLQKVTDLACPILNPIFQEILKMRSKRPTERANQLSTYTFSAKDAP